MLIYGIIVLVAGVAILVLSILLCLGHIGLLHDYHTKNIKEEDKKKAGISIGLSLSILAIGMLVSGILSFIIDTETFAWISLLILFIPMFISIVLILFFIKKYNGKIID